MVRTGTLCAEVIIPISATKGRLLYVHVVGQTTYKENDPRLEVTSALTGLKQIKKIWHAELIDKNGDDKVGTTEWKKYKPKFLFEDDTYDYISGHLFLASDPNKKLTSLAYMDDPRWTACEAVPNTFGRTWNKWNGVGGERIYTRFFIPEVLREQAEKCWETYLSQENKNNVKKLPESLFKANYLGGASIEEVKMGDLSKIGENDIKDKKIALSIGHMSSAGGAELKGGAADKLNGKNISEYEFYKPIAHAIGAAMMCDVYIVNRGDANIYLYQQGVKSIVKYREVVQDPEDAGSDMRVINNLGVNIDCVVALHFNSSDNKNAKGCETYWKDRSARVENRASGSLNKSKQLANSLHNKIKKALNTEDKYDRGLKGAEGTNSGFINGSKFPAALIEPFFGSNIDESNKAYAKRTELAKAIAHGILEYLKTN